MRTAGAHGFARFLSTGALVTACTSVLGIDEDYILRSDAGSITAGGTESFAGGLGASPNGGAPWNEGGVAGSAPPAGGAAAVDASPQDAANPPDARRRDARADVTRPVPSCGSDGECGPNEKCCFDRCVAIGPFFGCRTNSCDVCPAPIANGEATCSEDGTCAIACAVGFEPSLDECQPVTPPDGGQGGSGGQPETGGSGGGGASGGSGAEGGSGGSDTACDPSECPKCFPPFVTYSCCTLLTRRCGCTYVEGLFCQ